MEEKGSGRTGPRTAGRRDRIASKGEGALRFLYGVMRDGETKLDTRLQAAKLLLEYCFGKSAPAAEARTSAPGPLDGLSMEERLALLKALAARPDELP